MSGSRGNDAATNSSTFGVCAGMSGAHRSSGSFSGLTDNDSRSSIDSRRSSDHDSPLRQPNGHSVTNSTDPSDENSDSVAALEQELQRTREEKETLASQYRNLLAKLTQMRTSLGNKLQQDAEELDRREQLMQQLNAEKEDLNVTVEKLKAELIASHAEAERVSGQLDAMRNQVLQESAQESLQREMELRETQMELERCRIERDEWERSALEEQTVSEELRSTVEELRRETESVAAERSKDAEALEREKQKSENLQSVLQDFQAARDHELSEAVKDLDSKLLQTTQSLAEYKHRAHTAELALEESHANSVQTQELERKVKEKKALIEKLRHEAVIINEHLMEALRRLRRNSSENNVDRRLVTNVILSFLQTPRGDAKRFEILTLLASILSWTEQEREKAGLQRSGPLDASNTLWGRSQTASSLNKSDHEKTEESESFSRLWVEFLLTEAASGELPANKSSGPALPRNSLSSLSPSQTNPSYPIAPMRRLSSLGGPPVTNSPNLLAGSSSKKGKEKGPS